MQDKKKTKIQKKNVKRIIYFKIYIPARVQILNQTRQKKTEKSDDVNEIVKNFKTGRNLRVQKF